MMDWKKKYSEYVLGRLEEYGYEPGMYPKKYTAYTQVNGVVKIRLSTRLDAKDIPKSGNKLITETYYREAVKEVDVILPRAKK